MENNRLWHEPAVEIFSNLITPGVRCAAEAYDLANRRWYRLEVDSVIQDDDWLSSVVAKHVSEHYAENNALPPWNTIQTTAHATPVAFKTTPDDLVDRPITLSLSYRLEPTESLPTANDDELSDITYISRSADRCTWRGKDCVFKRIEFNVDIRVIKNEIHTRERLINAMGPDIGDANRELVARFRVTPVLAVIIGHSKPWKPGTVAGVLMPFAGQDLEILSRDSNGTLPISMTQLRELVRGVNELKKAGVEHGDIRYWNTVLQPDGDGPGQLLLIDIGSEGPDYDGDAKALGRLLLWCLENTTTLSLNQGVKARVAAASNALAREDFDTALAALAEDK